jgi:hypothetical protein
MPRLRAGGCASPNTRAIAPEIASFGAIVREALRWPLGPEEQFAIAELVESLRELLGDAVDP